MLVLALAAGWLLPNHYKPWGTFHNSAWIASVLAIVAFWKLARGPDRLQFSRAAVFLAVLAAIPWAQHAIGRMPLASDANLNALYLLGLAAVFALGEHWERTARGEPAGFVLSAACVAGIACVFLQVYQWLGFAKEMDILDVWILPSDGERPYANLAQPNQLASLLLWGVLGAAWAWHKRWVRPRVAVPAAAFLLLGTALTESRTALLTLTLGAAVLTVRPPAFLPRRAIRTAQLLYVFYLACLFGLDPLARLWDTQAPPATVFERSAGELRFVLWRAALQATFEQPWLGYGWNRTNAGLLSVVPQFPALAGGSAFEQSHSIVLDLLLWVGWPLGVLILAAFGTWLWRVCRSASDLPQLLTVCALVVMLVHAALELPLHHAYFLLPFGLLAGAASGRVHARRLVRLPRRIALALTMALSAVLALVIHDYLRIEAAFTELRFQLQHVGRGHDESRPVTFVLNDWADFIAMTRATAHAGMSREEIAHWEDLLVYNAAPLAFHKVIAANYLNGNPARAQYWVVRSCTVLNQRLCTRPLSQWDGTGTQPKTR